MKNTKTIFFGIFLILVVGMIGCSSGGSSSGGNSTPPSSGGGSATDPLVGTWRCDSGIALGTTLTFNADHTGNANGSGFHDWNLSGNILTLTLDSGAGETFQLDWDNASKNGFTFTNLNPATPDVTHYIKAS
jgi:hypothetical protein